MDKIVRDEMLKRIKETGTDKYLLYMETISTLNLAARCYTGNPNTFFSLTLFSLVLYSIRKLKKTVKKEIEFKQEHAELYNEVKTLYDEYTTIISKELSKYHFDNSLDLCILLDALLINGYFSSTDKLEYHKYKKYIEYYDDLLGTLVLTGKCVCRHNTSLINDILTKLNIDNIKLHCYHTGPKRPTKIYRRANHVITLVHENKFKYAYDFTNHGICNIEDNNVIRSDSCLEDGSISSTYYAITRDEELNKFKDYDSFNMGPLGYVLYLLRVLSKYEDVYTELNKSKKDNKELMREISEKSLILMPRKDI